jgi:hypothetical protein
MAMRSAMWAAMAMAGVAIFAADVSFSPTAAYEPAAAYAQAGQGQTGVQRRVRVRRAPTRIRVYRLPYGYPGPNAVRQCSSWLAQEHRPSGTVIVPRMRCWWQHG